MEDNFKESSNKTVNENEICEKSIGESITSKEALDVLVSLGKKQLLYQRVGTGCLLGMLLVLIISVMIMIPKVTTTLSHINSVAVKAEESLDKVDDMVADVSNSAGKFDSLLDQNATELTEAITSISEIDFEGLNTAIKDLQDAVGPMATFMNRFR